MATIHINSTYQLAVTTHLKRLRLIIFKDGEEYVCRIESLRNLQTFLSQQDAHLFKGRLQIHKKLDILTILIQQQVIGSITTSQFRSLLPY